MSDSLGPVEVEFTIPDSFGKEADVAIKSMARLTTAATDMPKKAKAAVLEQKAIIKTIEADIKQLEKALNGVAAGKAKQETIQELTAAKRALDEEKASLTQMEAAYDEAADANRRLTYRLRDLQDQLTKMRLAGRQNTEEYKAMEIAAARLADEIRDVRNVTKNLADDQADFTGFAQGITGLTGAFSAAGGAVALFAGENENLQKIQTKVQGLMAITIGLQQVSTTLNKDSAFMTVTVARAKQLWAAAEGRLTVALWGSNAAAKALMATMTLGAAIAIPALIALYDRLVKKQDEAVKAQKEAKRITTDANIEAGKARIEIDQMINKLQTFRGSKEAEKKLISEVNKAYGDTFGTYKTLAQWLDVLKQKAAQYVQVMFLQTKATRLVDKAIKFDTQAQEVAAKPLTDFVDYNDVQQATNIFGKVDEVRLKQIAEERKRLQLDNANARRDLALKESEIIQGQLQDLQNSAGINVFIEDDDNKKDAKQTYAQKLAEVKQFFELYKQAIDLGQTEAAAIFAKKLPNAASYEEYISQELAKANAAGNLEKAAALIPEQNEISTAFKELLKQYQTYSEERAEIERKYNAEILKLTQAGYNEKAAVAIEARDKELKALDDSQPLNKLLEKYKTYRGKVKQITEDSQKEIDALRAAGYNDEAKEAELKRDQEINKLILDNEFQQYEKIEQLSRREIKAFMEKVKIKIDLLRAEGKAVDELQAAYDRAGDQLISGDIKGIAKAGELLSSMAGAAGKLNEEFGRMVGLAGSLTSNLAPALEGFKSGGSSAISSFGTVVNILATISNELDRQFGRQARIAEIESERQEYNTRLRMLIDDTTAALDRQLMAIERLSDLQKPGAINESLEFIQNSIKKTQGELNNIKFEFLPAPDELNQTVDIAFLKVVTKAETEAEAIRKALATGLISQEQADIALEYLRILEELNETAGEMSEQVIELRLQTNSVELMNSVADAIVNAFDAGTDATIAWGQVVDQVIRNAMINALMLKYLEEPIKQATEAVALAMEDVVVSPEEMALIKSIIDKPTQDFFAGLSAMEDIFNFAGDEAANETASRGFSQMTQQTGVELLGQFTALRMSAAAINDLLHDERQARASMRMALEAIVENTSYCRRLEGIENILRTIETDGVRMR